MLRVVILAGGRGERFWPLSRRLRPKPFLVLKGAESLLADTVRRARAVAPAGSIRVMAGAGLAAAIRRDLRGLGGGRMLVEPASRNTGPAALLASRLAWGEERGAELLLLPSDHWVEGVQGFRKAVAGARALARRGYLVTFGIPPEGPHQEYGYMVPGQALPGGGRRVSRFVEKPDAKTARKLIRRQGAVWNSGMFLWRADVFLEEASRCEPAFSRWLGGAGTGKGISRRAREAFSSLPSVPVDRAVLERSRKVAMVKAPFRWSDLGTWSSLGPILSHRGKGNASLGDFLALDSRNNLAVNPGGLTVLAGVRDLLVARKGEIVLVCSRRRSGKSRELLRRLEEAGYDEYL